MKRKGIATQLLERVYQDAVNDGFDFVEVYADKEPEDENINFSGPVNLYKKCGFTVYYETKEKLVMRKPTSLSGNISRL
jgi:GNAT superfamily N-acetyltransferase